MRCSDFSILHYLTDGLDSAIRDSMSMGINYSLKNTGIDLGHILCIWINALIIKNQREQGVQLFMNYSFPPLRRVDMLGLILGGNLLSTHSLHGR